MIRRQQCPVCRSALPDDPERARRFLPFCSHRCRSIDLLRWSKGQYAITEQLTEEEAELLRHDPDITVVEQPDQRQ